MLNDAEQRKEEAEARLRDLMEPAPFDPVHAEGTRLAQEARHREAERERHRRELQEQVNQAVALARDTLGKHAGPEAVAILASAVLGRRYLS